MTPQDFIAKWRASPKQEQVDAQPHFLDLYPASFATHASTFSGAKRSRGLVGIESVDAEQGCR